MKVAMSIVIGISPNDQTPGDLAVDQAKLREAARDAVENELRAGEDHGFCHTLDGVTSLTVVSVKLIEDEPAAPVTVSLLRRLRNATGYALDLIYDNCQCGQCGPCRRAKSLDKLYQEVKGAIKQATPPKPAPDPYAHLTQEQRHHIRERAIEVRENDLDSRDNIRMFVAGGMRGIDGMTVAQQLEVIDYRNRPKADWGLYFHPDSGKPLSEDEKEEL